MSPERLVVFRSGSDKFGVPVKNVGGVTKQSLVDSFTEGSQRFIEMPTGIISPHSLSLRSNAAKSRSTMWLYSNGMQIALLVDEIVAVKEVSSIKGAATNQAVFHFIALS